MSWPWWPRNGPTNANSSTIVTNAAKWVSRMYFAIIILLDSGTVKHDKNKQNKQQQQGPLVIVTGRFPVGQNLGLEWTTGPVMAPNWKKMITKWYEEVQDFPNSSVARYK